jgi:hypothetical protein
MQKESQATLDKGRNHFEEKIGQGIPPSPAHTMFMKILSKPHHLEDFT